ncbi:MAG: transglutaminase family protein [Candidatus Competibacterales bacterium]
MSDYAVGYPFVYNAEDGTVLAPYCTPTDSSHSEQVAHWIPQQVWSQGTSIQTYDLLQRLSRQIQQSLRYQIREAPGVQTATETLNFGSGSCRDFANLFIEVARQLGLAARFVSGYLNAPPSTVNYGATHAWAEVYLPGAGWKGFDPTLGELVGSQHIPVAVARLPESVPPVAGGFYGFPGASLDVGVWVSPLGSFA